MAYEIVVFCVDTYSTDKEQSERWQDTLAQLTLLWLSAQAVDPDVSLTILTNETSSFTTFDIPFRPIIRSMNTSQLMLERTKSQYEFLKNYDFDKPVAFLDSDILINKSLGTLFAQDFDIGLTTRSMKKMPFNGGVIFCNNLNTDAVTHFFQILVETYLSKYERDIAWYGDQLALKDVVDDINTNDGANIKLAFLPSAEYNYSFKAKPSAILRAPTNKYLIHFKGDFRKNLMEPFWKIYIQPSDKGRISKRVSALRYWLNTSHPKQENKHYNLSADKRLSWISRAETAAQMLSSYQETLATPLKIADIGCGDGKFAQMMLKHSINGSYKGYDLHPQDHTTTKLNLENEYLPEPYDVGVVLGVIEYSKHPKKFLANISHNVDTILISYAPKDHAELSVRRRRRLGWQNHYAGADFLSLLEQSNLSILNKRFAPDGRTLLCLCSGRNKNASI